MHSSEVTLGYLNYTPPNANGVMSAVVQAVTADMGQSRRSKLVQGIYAFDLVRQYEDFRRERVRAQGYEHGGGHPIRCALSKKKVCE